LSKVVSKESLIEAVKKRAPKGTEELNLSALELGYELARKRKRRSKKV